MTENNKSYSEWKAHYLAVRKRLGGLGPSAGLVPMQAVRPQPVVPETAEMVAVVEKPKYEPPKIVWDVKGMPKNNFFRLLIETAKKYNIDPNRIMAKDRSQYLVEMRRELIWRAVHECKYSRARVAKMMGRDHTTILHALECWERDHVARA